QRAEAKRCKIDLQKVQEVIGDAVPQPERGKDGKRNSTSRAYRPQGQEHAGNAEGVGDQLRRPNRPVVSLEQRKIDVRRERKRPHAATWSLCSAPCAPAVS